MKPVYLDYNATTPVDPRVAEVMMPFLKGKFGNPSSTHIFGREAREEVESARKKIGKLINAQSHEIIFTSGGTESNNLALLGIAHSLNLKGRHIITSRIEHPAILEVCSNLEQEGFRISYVDVDPYGMVNPSDVAKEIQPDTILVSIMHANNEVGTVQPVREISALVHEKGIVFHCDAAQSAGKIPIDVEEMGVDLLSLAGHKFYGPKGVGALYIRNGIKLKKMMYGANHEQNLRPGTENIMEIAGLGEAAEIAARDQSKNSIHMKRTRDLLEQLIMEGLPDTILNGHPQKRLPNTLNISFPGVDISLLFSELTEVAASAGAACHAEEITYSHVLKAMGIGVENAMGTIRLSTGKYTTDDEIRQAAKAIISRVKTLMPGDRITLEGDKNSKIDLTMYTHGLGCACKISPSVLEEVLKNIPVSINPDILVGHETSDDAAVYRINSETAIVQSVDFFTPVIDDPYRFGAIAAANALSDIYAMGAVPLFGLNIVGFPQHRLPMEVLKQILSGANEVCEEAGIQVIGGHTIEDNEPKFGMVITGTVHPEQVIRNKGAKPGDLILLTKPIGTGILSTALKRGSLDESQKDMLYRNMRSLNKIASARMKEFGVTAATDITGFGLLGHLRELCMASGVSAEIKFESIPLLPGLMDFVGRGMIPGGTENNVRYNEPVLNYAENITGYQKLILNDAQTSGGLLITIDKVSGKELLNQLHTEGIECSIIGQIIPLDRFTIRIA